MTEPQCATFCLQDEDHTLGNAVRWALMKKYGHTHAHIPNRAEAQRAIDARSCRQLFWCILGLTHFISSLCVNNSPEVDFASYSIPHPSEARTNIRVQTSDRTTAVEAVFKGLDDVTDICNHVISTFQAELAKGEFEYDEESTL
jgi:DNA-directed RNA polymerase I and III subunit RPAC2